jgi:regulatory protein YycH of two-component signal transduction system YycFG
MTNSDGNQKKLLKYMDGNFKTIFQCIDNKGKEGTLSSKENVSSAMSNNEEECSVAYRKCTQAIFQKEKMFIEKRGSTTG